MGNKASGNSPGAGPFVLESRDIPSIAKYMKSEECKNVFVMLGAGVSTSAGIPDFRSPGTGLYSNLARLKLRRPEDVFSIDYFRSNPVPFYTLAKELYPGQYRPTITHSFIRILDAHDLLNLCFTQNIDTLERRAGIPGEKIIEAHGSFAGQSCIDCGGPFDGEEIKRLIMEAKIPACESCGGLVKPDIVFFGESLPEGFLRNVPKLRDADLLFIIGTSLQVQPFASLTRYVPRECPRVLINMEEAGDIGDLPEDVVCLGKCDDIIKELARELGWAKELKEAWAETKSTVEGSEPSPDEARDSDEDAEGSSKVEETEEERLNREVDQMAKSVEETLRVTDVFKRKVRSDVQNETSSRSESAAAGSSEAGSGSGTTTEVKF